MITASQLRIVDSQSILHSVPWIPETVFKNIAFIIFSMVVRQTIRRTRPPKVHQYIHTGS